MTKCKEYYVCLDLLEQSFGSVWATITVHLDIYIASLRPVFSYFKFLISLVFATARSCFWLNTGIQLADWWSMAWFTVSKLHVHVC